MSNKRKRGNDSTGGGQVLPEGGESRRSKRRSGGSTIDKEELETQRCWGIYLKPTGWRYVAGNLQDHIFIPSSLKQYSTRIIKKYGTKGIHYFNGYIGLKDQFIEKKFAGVVGLNTPDKIIDNMKEWFKVAYEMAAYAPPPTAEMKRSLLLNNTSHASTMTMVPAVASSSSGISEATVKDTCSYCNKDVTTLHYRIGTTSNRYMHSGCYFKEKLNQSEEENKHLKAELKQSLEEIKILKAKLQAKTAKLGVNQSIEEDNEETCDETEDSFDVCMGENGSGVVLI